MRKRFWMLAAFAAMAAPALAGATGGANPILAQFSFGGGPRVTGSGKVGEEVRPVSGFSGLVLRAPVDVTLKSADAERVTLRGDDNILPLITTRIVNGQLEIDTQSRTSFSTGTRPKATVEFRQLDAIRVRSSGDVRVDTIQAPVLEIVLGGSGDVALDRIDVNALAVSIAGSGDVTARGRAASVGIVVEGSGDVRLADVEARQAAVRLRGSGDVTVNATERLEVDLAGSGDVRYRGSPQVTKKVRGSGSVAPLR